jgi:hypothetical protein
MNPKVIVLALLLVAVSWGTFVITRSLDDAHAISDVSPAHQS